MPSVPAVHIHVTERESDGTWEDCTWCSGIEFLRLAYKASIPATHAEAEALRADAGKPPTGGSNLTDLARGAKVRYGITIPARVDNNVFPKPGQVAVVQGSMVAFGPNHPLSKWDPKFDGGHAVCVINIDGTLFWCDPEAPTNAAVPVVISPADLTKFVNAFGGQSVIAPIKVEAPKPPQEAGMDTLVRNLTGKVGTVKTASNIRTAPHISATKVRTTTAAETHPLVGTVKGDPDPGNSGNTEWVVWYEGTTAVYTAIDNVPVIVAASTDDGYTKATQDAAVAAQKAADEAACKTSTASAVANAISAERSRIRGVLGI